MGHLGADPKNGEKFIQFSVAYTEYTKAKNGGDGFDSRTDWFDTVAFGFVKDKVAKLGLKKGDGVVVVGKLRNNSYENKEGKKITYYQIVAESVGVMKPKGTSDGKGTFNADNDIPF